MNPSRQSFEDFGTNYNYLFFENVTHFNKFVDERSLGLRESNSTIWSSIKYMAQNRLEEGTDWYGEPAPLAIEEMQNHKTFLGMALMRKIKPEVNRFLDKFLSQLSNEIMPVPQLTYNSLGLGIFSFDQAMLGMYRMSALNTDTPTDTLITQLDIALDRDGLRTIIRDVYAYEQNSTSEYPALRLYLMAGANANIQGKQMMYVGLACAELVEFMQLRNIPVEVNVLIGTSFQGSVYMAVVKVKAFQDGFNANQLLLMTSDPRYFRYRGFLSLVCLADYFGQDIPLDLGSLEEHMGKRFVANSAPSGIVFEQSYSLQTAAGEVKRIVELFHKRIKDGNNTEKTSD